MYFVKIQSGTMEKKKFGGVGEKMLWWGLYDRGALQPVIVDESSATKTLGKRGNHDIGHF
jgi:hypothetical protein